MRKGVDELIEHEEYVLEYYPDIIMISESWTRDLICDMELSLYGFRLLRSDRLYS